MIYRCVPIEAQGANFAHTCRDRRPRRSGNKGRLLSKCRASFPHDIYPFVLGPSRTPVPTGLWVIFYEVPLSKLPDKSPKIPFQTSTTHSPQKKNGPTKETLPRKRSLPSANTGRALKNEHRHVRTISIGPKKTFSQKGFCGAFSLKKRPLRPQAPPGKFNFPQKRWSPTRVATPCSTGLSCDAALTRPR